MLRFAHPSRCDCDPQHRELPVDVLSVAVLTAARALCPAGTQGGPCSGCCDAVADGIARGQNATLMRELELQQPPAVCRRRSSMSERVGAACPVCDHTNLVHPNPGNPSLTGCVLCELLEVLRGAR